MAGDLLGNPPDLTDAQSDAIERLLDAFAIGTDNRFLPPELPRHLAQKPLPDEPTEEELEAAETSIYYWWWAFLRESSEYPPKARSGPISRLHRSFGDVGNDFREWWTRKGRHAFSEPYGPSVQVLYDSAWHGEGEDKDADRLGTAQELLVVVISKHLSQENIREDFRLMLNEHHPGKALKEYAYKKADVALFKRERIDRKSFPSILKAWQKANEGEKRSWAKIAKDLPPSSSKKERSKSLKAESQRVSQITDLRQLSTKAREYYKRAVNLIHYAARGDFPREK